jgi:hypothetical protein
MLLFWIAGMLENQLTPYEAFILRCRARTCAVA